ncbi:hypothetical protein ACEE49_01915 [[Pasteurella] aerogenes]|nr:hypothetical protein [[Pasteurella] aerogenes]UWZ93918.1 hypothetical protein HZ320_09895 [[Pasteurella] aerogenes]VEG69233.1 PRD domain-containing protein [[Pasteurella] aerogenes]
MSLQQRLLFLEQRHLIDTEVRHWVLLVRAHFVKKWQLNVHTKQMGMLFIHLAMALGRIRRGYCANALDDSIFCEMESAVFFPQVLARHQEILQLLPLEIPFSEQTHLIANLFSLALEQPQLLKTA